MSWDRFEPKKNTPYGECSCGLTIDSPEHTKRHFDEASTAGEEPRRIGTPSRHRVSIKNPTRQERIASWVEYEAESAARWHSDVDYLDGTVQVLDKAFSECAEALMRAAENGEVGIDEITATRWPDDEFRYAWLDLVEEKYPVEPVSRPPANHPTLDLASVGVSA